MSINSLPSKVLANIFELVLRSQHCCFQREDHAKELRLMYPELLSHVCTHWRTIAINSHTLWSHIDLIPLHETHEVVENLLARAKIFVARSSSIELEVHLYEPDPARAEPIDTNLTTFCTSIAPRTWSLQLETLFQRDHLPILESCLAYSSSGLLKELSLTDREGQAHGYIESKRSSTNTRNWLLDMAPQALEDLLLPVQFLRLDGVYFKLDSQAYHGLVELAIIPAWEVPRVTDSRLVQILESCPQLRALYVGLFVLGADFNHPPRSLPVVHLDQLEILNVIPMRESRPEHLLRLIAPGSKPLRFMVGAEADMMELLRSKEYHEFFARSNVTELLLHGENSATLNLCELLEFCPSLRAVSLKGVDLRKPCTQDIGSSRLETLCLLECKVDPADFGWMKRTEFAKIPVLKMWDCTIESQDGGSMAMSDIFPKRIDVPPTGSVSNDGNLFVWG
ncbi:F-box-like domain containing protein [Ceratobasidium theobromae]|uniref:F-box-like domain containing protein n=1 Tax=Ceratobasidium theobromae TaxID=1582974 RepID=A0A5N5QAT3_9AGAM|nr:F-box-like domain containing protein [Ceratobasidium theobromae]